MSRPDLRFIHPPRTGGTSIMKAWDLKAPEYRGHRLPASDDGFRYGFTRNPWDRAVSLFHLSGPREPDPASFQEWVASGMHGGAILGIRHAAPTVTWLDGCQFVGRFEHRQDDLAMLARMLGREVPELHANKTERISYEHYYDAATVETVALLYKADIDRFGYTFGG